MLLEKILKRFFNGEKISYISPLLHENKFHADFQVKSEILNFHFAGEYFLLKNKSQIPLQLFPHTNTCF